MGNSIVEKIIYSVNVCLDAPLCVSSGEAEYTDSDVQRDFDGIPFIPGTSLAGAMKDYLGKTGRDTAIFGTDGGDSRMSMVLVSDMRFKYVPKISVRDGVRLDHKIAVDGGKYDMEIIETGAEASFELEIVCRKETGLSAAEIEQSVKAALSAMENGDIRIGANKTRGFGKLKIVQVRRGSFTEKNVDDWIAFCAGKTDRLAKFEEWKLQTKDIFVTFSGEFALDGGISIRKYSTRPGVADFEHITCAGKAVVPGTSLNGAIRSRAGEILVELGYPENDITDVLEEWFGYVENTRAKQSQIIISESVLEGGEEITMIRNKVNRFDASTVESALYKEKAYFGGTAHLEVKVRKSAVDCDVICGLMLLVLKDLAKGYLAVGGQTSVGRGIFKGSIEAEQESAYFRALKDFVETGMKKHV